MPSKCLRLTARCAFGATLASPHSHPVRWPSSLITLWVMNGTKISTTAPVHQGLIRLSSTTVNVPMRLLDYGSMYGDGIATHHLTLYRHNSGALVFGAGTVQWSWGLDGEHDRGSSTPDLRMQQATVNLLADMSVQPATLQSGLVAATASTDISAPDSTITSPANSASVQVGTTVTITGTATDSGGVVGGVEVSVDGGTTWHPSYWTR